ncbi:hypothetical protein ACP4OV_015040 [Aristida adscensionis]
MLEGFEHVGVDPPPDQIEASPDLVPGLQGADHRGAHIDEAMESWACLLHVPESSKDGTGCPFWFWEDDYEKYLEELEKNRSCMVHAAAVAERDGNGAAVGVALLAVGKEIAALLKQIVLLLVVAVFVLIMLLCSELNK